MKAHFKYEVQMDMKSADSICSQLEIDAPYKNDWFIIEPANEDYDAYASVKWPQEGLSFAIFLCIASFAMDYSNHPWTQFVTRCHMDDKGCSLWDTVGKGYANSEGFYNAKTLGISSHEKLSRIKDIINEKE